MLKATVNNVSGAVFNSIKSGDREVWIVSVSDEISNGKSNYYFDKRDRRLWKQEMEFNGVKFLLQHKE